jgi:dolichol kinase
MHEFWRKTVHLIFGLLITFFILTFPKDMVIMLLAAGLLGGLWFIDLAMRGINVPVISHLLYYLERDGVFPGKGAFFFVFSAFIITILFSSEIAATGVLVLAVLDGFATLIGLRYGRIRIINHKSIEGTAGAIIITIGVLFFFLSPIQAIVIAFIAGLVELASPVDDNLLIPLVVAILLAFIPW